MSEAGCCSEEGHVAVTQSTVNGGGSADTATRTVEYNEDENRGANTLNIKLQISLVNRHTQPHFPAAQVSPTLCLSIIAVKSNQDSNTSLDTKAYGNPDTEPSSRGDENCTNSSIPRGASLKPAANSSSVKGVRSSSLIPVPIQRRSAEQLGATLQKRQSETCFSGARLVEKPRGPRPRPPSEQTTLVHESTEGMERKPGLTPPSASSSTVSSWDFRDIGDPERPPTVFTGEHRTRVLGTPGHRSPGPTLKIASSAEDVIMGGASGEASKKVDAQPSTPSLFQRLDKLTPNTPKDTNKIGDTALESVETPHSKGSGGNSQGSTPSTRKLCRPQLPLDSIQKRDISGKEMSISRKTVNKPSLSSLFSPSSRSLRPVDEPIVPKIPERYHTDPETGIRQVPSKMAESETPVKVASEFKDTTKSEPESTPMPVTAIKVSAMSPHPPRTSSLQALTNIPICSGSASSSAVTGEASTVATNLRRNVTFNDIAPFASHVENLSQSPDKSRLFESRSNHLLGSFRNIFRSRSGTAEKERVRKVDVDAPITLTENQAPSTEGSAAKDYHLHNNLEKGLKLKPKHTRLSSGVSWNRSSRNPKNAESPTTPTPSVPRLLAPPHRDSEGNIPSFARPTRSTRIKANSGSKEQASGTLQGHGRRSHVRTASTGSPQRLTHGSRRTTGNLLMLSTQKRAIQSPSSVSGRTVGVLDLSIGCTQPKNLDAFRACLETLCKKVGEALTSQERDRHLRLALSLQQQLADYQGIEKAALDTETLAKEKLLERQVAEEALNTSLAEVQSQIEMD
ncbi:hypothetical protein AN0899.2 [Aspergillus nidulans FGSC A4]|uniref:Uncharacterized protein n=1 Tax=Emericella nidulans (strain FGSC A4 / ATCC 38163 / CBS 112.46 / NRRL 194 / M139) TaxID=227321 RepID=Q5BEY1_EMENI|nr:hypothetical protein [Aspergillus nidulans FGSC A4]EAA65928.1 hypothetical protein AN0899.2 [Aspergillus nidulans FGSC A4]CBF88564.1 TPA: conserved hypothetical protein [Aspergillus nidulans FGSC A4]|eukprot:XP_658503.1 hypothetical protein AN0899.2 [Aspergillus nidulans FGSC A4]